MNNEQLLKQGNKSNDLQHLLQGVREAHDGLDYYNKWRRGWEMDMPQPKVIGRHIDQAILALRFMEENLSESKPVFRVSKDEHNTYLYVDDHLTAMQRGHGIDRLPELISECGGDIKDYIKVKNELKELEE